ncbi:MAG: amidohydrolase family protein [Thermodesulfobacteriota bacterium]|nr:amidohydrolase family protein [Thermodesulfobacteriota bacterium]
MKIIDSHIHCGIQNVNQPFELVKKYMDEGGVQGACFYAPVEDIYDRYDYHFEDNYSWIACRQRANRYLLDIQKSNKDIFAYFFVWNDFRRKELRKGYKGIKWHRHEDEPVYHYDDPRCEEFLQEIYRLQLPIVLEEPFENTLYFIKRVAGQTPIIIPHLGGLNGGFSALFRSGIWDDETVYADTALASTREMAIFLEKYGSKRLLFGSDFPFSTPRGELSKVKSLKLNEADFQNVVSNNILKLMKVLD